MGSSVPWAEKCMIPDQGLRIAETQPHSMPASAEVNNPCIFYRDMRRSPPSHPIRSVLYRLEFGRRTWSGLGAGPRLQAVRINGHTGSWQPFRRKHTLHPRAGGLASRDRLQQREQALVCGRLFFRAHQQLPLPIWPDVVDLHRHHS